MNEVLDQLQQYLDGNGFKVTVNLDYSGKFKSFNANVRKAGSRLQFGLSSEWQTISPEIVLGLLQSLSAKVLKFDATTTNMDLYNNFIRSLHISSKKTISDPYLEQSFARINEKYFHGIIDVPNFAWHHSLQRLASYEYQTDTVSVSDIFRGYPELVDYLIYHELLHKKLKFYKARSRSVHHSIKFRQLEQAYDNHVVLEKKISDLVRRNRRYG